MKIIQAYYNLERFFFYSFNSLIIYVDSVLNLLQTMSEEKFTKNENSVMCY